MPDPNAPPNPPTYGPSGPTGSPARTEEWLVEEFSTRLESVFESLAGARPAIERTAAEAPPAGAGALLWRQPFSALAGALWVVAQESDWTAAGTHILGAAGLRPEDCDADTIRSSYSEALQQALGGVAQGLTGRLRREVTPVEGKQASQLPGAAGADTNAMAWSRLDFEAGGKMATLYAGIEPALAAAIEKENAERKSSETAQESNGKEETRRGSGPEAANQLTRAAAAGAGSAGDGSRKFDLLLDVELPISVSFGTAEVPLKDVLKLTTGSIVELNRTILEPVEVVVNNCVIARGEVVVIEGNFGVRIKQVISRQDRIRTLR